MIHEISETLRRGTRPAPPQTAVTDIASRRRSEDILCTLTFVFGGVNYGTVRIAQPYTKGKPIALYLIPHQDGDIENFTGPLDCLITDQVTLACDASAAQ